MSSIKNNILYFIIVSFLVQVRSLVEVPNEEAVEIVAVESSIRKIVNEIFSALKLEDVKHKPRIKEFSTIHNFFVTITLQDQTNLKEIAALVKVDNVDNKTQHFITQLNEILNEDNKSDEEKDDVYVTTHIETFVKKLEYLKDKYGFTNNDPNFGINAEILKHLKRDDASKNTTQETDDNNVLSDLEVWKPDGRRVYRGHRGKIKHYPFVASVQFFKKFQCGGSIIKSDLVITSASCLQLAWNNRFFRENPAFLSVQVGSDVYEGGDENIPILEVYFHPEYDPQNLRNNLAIMRLLRYLKFGKRFKKIKKIDFDRSPSALPSNTDGITIIGWGARSSSNIINNVWTNRLSYAVLDFYPLRECQDVYSKDYVTYKNFCAGFFSKGGGACNRDVGGPGVANGILVGVVSFGSPTCGAPDSPTVFTKLGYYTQWIENILEMEPPPVKAKTTHRPTRRPFKVEHYMTTRYHYKLSPVTESTSREREPYKITAVPIKSIDALRALNESTLFKDFITTMFGSEEVKEYLDQSDYTTDKSSEDEEKLNMEAEKLLEMMRMNTAPTVRTTVTNKTKATPKVDTDYESNSVEMVTTMDDFDFSDDTGRSHTTPKSFIDYTALPENDEKIEEKIAKLIDEIDIKELLKSESSDSSADLGEEIKPIAITTNVPVHKASRVTPSATDESSSYNDDNVDDGHVEVDVDDEGNDEDDDGDEYDEDDDDDNDKAESNDPFLNLVDLAHKMSALSQNQPQQQQKQQQHQQKQYHQKEYEQKQHQQKEYEQKQHRQKEYEQKQHRQKEYEQKQHQQKEYEQKQHRQKEYEQQQHQQKEYEQKEHRQNQNRQTHHQQKEQQPYYQQQPEQGLSIPAASFKDFTFRQNSSSIPNSGSILDLFTQSDLMRLLSEVVADATKGAPSDNDVDDYDLSE